MVLQCRRKVRKSGGLGGTFSVKRVCLERCSFSIVCSFLGRKKSWLDTFVGTHFGQESMDIFEWKNIASGTSKI